MRHLASSPASDNMRSLSFSNDTQDITLSYPYGYDEAEEAETDEEFVCELESGMTVPIEGTTEQISELRSMLNSGELVSAISTVEATDSSPGEFISDGEGTPAFIDDGSMPVMLAPGPINLINTPETRRRLEEHRKLNRYHGRKKVLGVRVIDRDGRAVP